MDRRAGFIVLFVVLTTCGHTSARSVTTLDAVASSTDIQVLSGDSKAIANEQLCTLCQEYTTEVVEYFSNPDKQSEIVSTLHQVCSYLHGLKHKCILLVDYYAPLLFKEIATIQPELFCKKATLCKGMVSVRLQKHDDICTECHRFVGEILNKLEDPETQLEIIQTLLKGCNKLDSVVQECKKLVFEYGPIILANVEKFVETRDLCADILVCKAPKATPLRDVFLSSA